MTDHHLLLGRALALARESRDRGDHPFGALLALDGEIVAEAHNRVRTDADLTAHAETMLVRNLERDGLLDLLPRGLVVASCEPCPMCTGALFWAGARHVVFGLSARRLGEVSTAPDEPLVGFTVTAAQIGAAAQPPMLVEGPFDEDEAALVHEGFWFPSPS